MLENCYPLLKWILLAPLAGFLFNGLPLSRRFGEKTACAAACLAIFLAFIFSVFSLSHLLSLPAESRLLRDIMFNWISAGALSIDAALRFDPLSAVMALVVTGVSFLIHVYSAGYMHGDKGYRRYFSYLNLFVFFMLLLVLADNPFLMFVGWEGVGLCSYLLIGFWYKDPLNSAAGKKAFIVNRVGDAGFLLGLMLLTALLSFQGAHGTDFSSLAGNVSLLSGKTVFGFGALSVIGVLLFFGATGKSAQFPLYIWLPDAMAGPTPVSALIHAATMVTAGVYMIARMSFLYALAPGALMVVLVTGCFTAFFAALIAMLQRDIKKVLAYSTISQIGYMFMAAGSGAYAAAIFHLVTHAFFKALLFLGAGSVIHAMAGEQDMFRMGALRKEMAFTFLLMSAGWLAIAGVPPLAGFYSKDLILEIIFEGAGGYLWAIGLLTAAITAFYMTRLMILTFLRRPGAPRSRAHESPPAMTLPMTALALMAICAGWLGKKYLLVFLEPAAIHGAAPHALLLSAVSVAAVTTAIASAFLLTLPAAAAALKKNMAFWHTLVFNKFYVDEIYNAAITAPLKYLSGKVIFGFFDVKVIDGLFVNGSAGRIYSFGTALRRLQSGQVQAYALAFILGLTVILYCVL